MRKKTIVEKNLKCIEKGLGNGKYLLKENITIYLPLVFLQNMLPSLYFHTADVKNIDMYGYISIFLNIDINFPYFKI